MEKKYHIYDALKILIELSKEAQRNRHDGYSQVMSRNEWLKEFCTIRVCSSRRTGHTTAISRLIKEDKMKLGVIFPGNIYKEMFREDLVFSTTIQNYENDFCGRTFKNLDGIVIDISFLLSQNKQIKLYSLISSSLIPPIFGENGFRPFFIIFLQ